MGRPAHPVAVLALSIAVSVGLFLGLAFAGGPLGAEPAGAAPRADEHRFVQLINELRSAEGLAPLVVDPELTAEARAWTATMAAAGTLAHSPDITEGITSPWIVLGENVGRHGIHDLDALFDAFVASPSHRANLLDPRYSHLGVGVLHGEGDEIWTTHRFMALDPAVVPPPEPDLAVAPLPEPDPEPDPDPVPALPSQPDPGVDRQPDPRSSTPRIMRWPDVFYEIGSPEDFLVR